MGNKFPTGKVSGTNVDKVQGLETLPPIPLTPLPELS